MTDNEYVYEIIDNENDARICAQLIAEEFTEHNPMTVFGKITSKCFFDTVSWPLIEDMINEKLSFLARYRSTGDIVAAVIAGDLYKYHEKHPYDPYRLPQVIPASDLLDEMDHIFIQQDFGQILKSNMVLNITTAAVRHQHIGKGIATQLHMTMCNYARDKIGFQYAFVQVTNPATRHIYLNKMNGKEVTIIDPTTWIWKHKRDELLCPYKDYKHGPIANILIKL